MKLKEFDFKLPRDEVRKKKIMFTSISVIALILIVTIVSTFAYYQSIENQNPINTSVGEFSSGDLILAVTIDGEPSNTFPTKGSGYVANSVTCDKGATGTWDDYLWNIQIEFITHTQTKCSIDFVEDICLLSENSNKLRCKIMAQFGGVNNIATASTNTFASVSSASDALMYKMEDDYGMSYYYRGAKDLLNNNLIFAEHQWKIIRINGDGSIRIIYNGACPNNNCAINSAGAVISSVAWNIANNNDAKYVGYMYGGSNGTASTSRAQAVTNQTSSNAKTQLESWYTVNIVNKGYASYVSDTLFCNDRRLRSEVGGAATGTGYGTSQTHYATYYNLNQNKKPNLICGNKNDKFTANDATNGNTALTHPIALITADEASLAGGMFGAKNDSYYLHVAQVFWTLSPQTSSSFAAVWSVHYSVSTSLYPYNVDEAYGLRPVINLNYNTKVSGDGSISNPFVVI